MNPACGQNTHTPNPYTSLKTVPGVKLLTELDLQSIGKWHFFPMLFLFYLQKEKNNSGKILRGARNLVSNSEFYCSLEISHWIFRVYDADLATG